MSQLFVDTDKIKISDAIEEGVELCRMGSWETGLKLLWKAARHEQGSGKELTARYYSFLGYGIASTQRQMKEGLRLCVHGVRLDRNDPECWLNLARVYHLGHQRRKAVAALGKGLAISPDHPDLLQLQRDLGRRRRPVLPFLPRSNPINRWLGRRRHERLERDRQPG